MSDYLKKVLISKGVSVYEILPRLKVKRFVISTPFTRKILNRPEICGFEYVDYLRQGLTSFFRSSFGRKYFSCLDDSKISVLHFLRGGLNFGLLEILYKCFGFSRVNASFMTSQRVRKGAHWRIKHDQYRKFALDGISTVMAADVIATGTTLKNGLDCLKVPLKHFLFFTIGTSCAEKILLERFGKLGKRNPGFSAALFYIEGRFALVEKDGEYPFSIKGTDLVKKGALLPPEFERGLDITSILERCEVYDVGARAFDRKRHLADIFCYWRNLFRAGVTVSELYNRRWPFEWAKFSEYSRDKKRVWPDAQESLLRKLYEEETRRKNRAGKIDSKRFFQERLNKLKKWGNGNV
ncbi:MAG: hypothetical protein ABIJ15_07565 [bacterium]